MPLTGPNQLKTTILELTLRKAKRIVIRFGYGISIQNHRHPLSLTLYHQDPDLVLRTWFRYCSSFSARCVHQLSVIGMFRAQLVAAWLSQQFSIAPICPSYFSYSFRSVHALIRMRRIGELWKGRFPMNAYCIFTLCFVPGLANVASFQSWLWLWLHIQPIHFGGECCKA